MSGKAEVKKSAACHGRHVQGLEYHPKPRRGKWEIRSRVANNLVIFILADLQRCKHWAYMFMIPAFRRGRQEDQSFQASLDYIEKQQDYYFKTKGGKLQAIDIKAESEPP